MNTSAITWAAIAVFILALQACNKPPRDDWAGIARAVRQVQEGNQ